MKNGDAMPNQDNLFISLESLQQSLMSSATKLESIATLLEDAYLDSSDLHALEIQEQVQQLMGRIRHPSST